jgi:hypothetical protein
MAGSHADLPAPKIEYDRDGSRVYFINGSNVVTEISASKTYFNDESAANVDGYDSVYIGFVFPYRMDISHIYIDSAWGAGVTWRMEGSNDSTTLIDGTWTLIDAAIPTTINQVATRYRSDIYDLAGAGAANYQMIRLKANTGDARATSIHLYGKATTGQALHRMRLWHPTLDEPLDNHPTHFDWGNVQQNSTGDKTFRVKNDSPSLAASGIKVFMQALTEVSPSQVGQHTLSADGTTFVAAASPGVSVANLAAQAISPVLTLRRTTPVNAQLALSRQRLVTSAATWT